MSIPASTSWDAGVPDPDGRPVQVRRPIDEERLPARRVVLMVSASAEAEELIRSWTGQAVDVRVCCTLTAALLLTGRMNPAVVVIGGVQGSLGPIDYLRTLRTEADATPVILGLDDSQKDLGVDALTAGATAIMRRPFSAEDLLRILSFTSPTSHYIPVRPLPIDVGGRLRVDGVSPRMWLDDVETLLPPTEHLLLRYLAGRPGEVVPRRELVNAVWGNLGPRSSNTLSVHLGRLRRRLEGDTGDDWIRSVRGFGYQFLIPRSTGRAALPAGT